MDISEIRITLRDDNKLKGFASITLDNAFVIRGLKIIEGASGLFIAMPSRKRKDGTFQDIAHPINMETREWMEAEIIAAYRAAMLREAQQRPQDYRHLLVRVTGYNAYFTSIGRELQDEIIARLSHQQW